MENRKAMGNFTENLNRKMSVTDKKNYYRFLYQSYMTAPEWRNVEISEDFAHWMQEDKSMFAFPYLKQIFSIWRILFLSYRFARKHDSDQAILTSEYMVMDLFVTIFTTGELMPKVLLAALLYCFLPKKNSSEMQQHMAEYFKLYAEEIQTQPFYKHDYKHHREQLALKYNSCERRTWVDWFSWKSLSADLWTKRWVGAALQYIFQPGEGEEPSPVTTDILVKFKAKGVTDEMQAKEQFVCSLEKAVNDFEDSLDSKTEEDEIKIVGTHMYCKDKNNDTAVYTRLTSPRYTDFPKAINALAQQGIFLRKIAGQNQVQVKCELNAHEADNFMRAKKTMNHIPGVQLLYTYCDGISDKRELCLFAVLVKNLHETLQKLEAPLENEVSSNVKFVHNF